MNIKDKLQNGDVVLGTWLNSGSAIIAEIFASQGFDFVCVDVEHSPMDMKDCFNIFQGISSGNKNCAPAVRLQEIDYGLTKRYLDAGARIIIGPLVNSVSQAELLIEATKYPPIGKRGVGYCRANNYGDRVNDEFKSANEEIVIAIQIEDIKAIDNLDDILQIKGIDVVFIGPYDLSASMGLTGQFDHPNFIDAKEKIISICNKNHVASGIHIVNPNKEELEKRVEEGYKFIAYGLDITMIKHVIKDVK